jgi:hypothetical protein
MRAGVRFVVVAALVVGAGCYSDAPPELPESPKDSIPLPPGHGDISRKAFATPLPLADAETILRETTLFEVGGMPPKRQVQAFNVVYEQPDAVARFQAIGRTAGPAGRLYALAGLALLDPMAGRALAESLSTSAERIAFMDSDVAFTRSIRDLAGIVETSDMGTRFRHQRDEIDRYFAGKQE